MIDTELREKIERNTSLKTSTHIVVSKNSTKIKTTFHPQIELDRTRKYEMALVSWETYYSFPNLSDENNVFRYSILLVSLRLGEWRGRLNATKKMGRGSNFRRQLWSHWYCGNNL